MVDFLIMKEAISFNIQVHDRYYIVKLYHAPDNILYEIYTNCEKLFTLIRTSEGTWKTNETDIIPISHSLVDDIGEAVDQYEFELNNS